MERGEPAAQDRRQNWRRYQSGFADLSSSGEVRVAHEAGHMIPHEAPGDVMRAIRDVVEMARGRRHRRPSLTGERS